MLKLLIVIAVIGAGLFIGLPKINESYSIPIVESFTEDIQNIKEDTAEQIEQQVDESIDASIDYTGEVVKKQVNESAEKLEQRVDEKIGSFFEENIVSKIFPTTNNGQNSKSTGSSSSSSGTGTTSSNTNTISQTISGTTVTEPEIQNFETLTLNTKRLTTDSIGLNYADESNETESVKIQIISSNETIFDGIFYASEFETTINKISDQDYYIQMEIEHKTHGIIYSNMYNPAGNTQNTVSGIIGTS